jgi:signal transduction histidine kinase
MKPLVSSSRWVFAGFAGLLLLMGFLVVDAAWQTRNLSAMSAKVRKRSRDRDALLDQVRSDTYRSATLVRDYILEPDDSLAAGQKLGLRRLQAHTEQALIEYGNSAPADEKEAVLGLQQRSQAYWASLNPVLGWDQNQLRLHGKTFLLQTLTPDRNQVVEFVKQATALDEHLLDGTEIESQLLQESFQHRVTVISMITGVLGLLLAWVVLRHSRHLERQAEERFTEVSVARQALSRLSDRLNTVQEDERRNLSRELHDDLGQSMTALLMEIGRLESERQTPPDRTESLQTIRHLAEDSVAKMRSMALLLRPSMLDELGLVPALSWLVKEVTRRTGLKVRVTAEDTDDEYPDRTRTCIYRTVQEAVHNCVKHSQASQVHIAIRSSEEEIVVTVEDDGVGFDPIQNKGLGLLGMTERVESVGGHLAIESTSNHGTVLTIRIPLEKTGGRLEQEGAV